MTIVIFCESVGKTAAEMIGKARQIAPDSRIVALCEEKDNLEKLALWGADEAVPLEFCPDDCVRGVQTVMALKLLSPDIALFPATVRGRFLSAWVAARADTGLTADCTELSVDEGGLLKQVRPAFGGNLTAEIICRDSRPQMASVRPGVFPMPQPTDAYKPVKTRTLTFAPMPSMMERMELQPVENGASLSQVQAVVTGGKGVGGKKGFDKLFELAELLHGAVGATRSAVDAGWISYAHQVGQTGVTVRPRLYLAFGVSGLIQHTVGMNGADTVVAVNTDRNAPIFTCADYGVIADWEQTADEMIRYLKERKA